MDGDIVEAEQSRGQRQRGGRPQRRVGAENAGPVQGGDAEVVGGVGGERRIGLRGESALGDIVGLGRVELSARRQRAEVRGGGFQHVAFRGLGLGRGGISAPRGGDGEQRGDQPEGRGEQARAALARPPRPHRPTPGGPSARRAVRRV